MAAINANTFWHVRADGDDTNNGAGFSSAETAGMFTDGAATVADTGSPVFTSASYSFVAADVGAWVFIVGAGTWIGSQDGWYQIVSVSGGAATLNAAIGAGVMHVAQSPTTLLGCCPGTPSPAGATWSLDYAQQAAAQYTYTDLASAGAGLTVSSALKPFAKQQVGNAIIITGGTNFNTGTYIIASVSGVTATVRGSGNITSGVGSAGTGGQGGSRASLGGLQASGPVAGNIYWVRGGSYSITTASTNVANGCLSASAQRHVKGYGTVPGDLGRPVITATGSISTFTVISLTGGDSSVSNLDVNCSDYTGSRAFIVSGLIFNCIGRNCTNTAFIGSTTTWCLRCTALGGSTAANFNCGAMIFLVDCVSQGSTASGFTAAVGVLFVRCMALSNTGTAGFNATSATLGNTYVNCVAYGNTGSGFVTVASSVFLNCIAEANGGYGYDVTGAGVEYAYDLHCAAFNNTSGDFNLIGTNPVDRLSGSRIIGTTSFFVNAAGGNFALNSTPGGGREVLRAGFPGTFPGLATTTGYTDIGAVQTILKLLRS